MLDIILFNIFFDYLIRFWAKINERSTWQKKLQLYLFSNYQRNWSLPQTLILFPHNLCNQISETLDIWCKDLIPLNNMYYREYEMVDFFIWEQMGKWNMKMFFWFWAFFTIGGIFYSWGQNIILGSRKSAVLGIKWTTVS